MLLKAQWPVKRREMGEKNAKDKGGRDKRRGGDRMKGVEQRQGGDEMKGIEQRKGGDRMTDRESRRGTEKRRGAGGKK